MCHSLSHISIPPSVVSIGEYCFSECTSLRQINFYKNSSLKLIKSFAFNGCSSLTLINIPFSLTEIETHAFENCHSLTQIIIPLSVNYIGKFAFNGCTSLRDITIPSPVYSRILGISQGAKINLIK